MLRSISNAISVRKLFYVRHPTDFQIATLTHSPVNFKNKNAKEREPCPVPPPPPPPPPKDDKMLWGTLALMVLAGGFVVYAKGSPEIRDWLSLNAPWLDDFIAIMYQENMTYGEFAEACIDDTKKFIDRMTGKNKPKKCSTDGAPVEDENPKKKEEIICGKGSKEEKPIKKEEITCGTGYRCDKKPEKKMSQEDEDKTICEKTIPPVVTQNICEIEKCMGELSDDAMNNYYTAREACACYNKLVEDTMATFSYKGMKELRPAMEERKKLVEESLRKASKCIYRLDEMVRYLDCGVQATKAQIKNTKQMHRDFHVKFKAGFMTYQWENDRSTVMDRQWQIVEEIVNKYTAENQYLFPGLDYSSKSPKMTGDIDIIFTNSLRYIKYLEQQLKETSDAMTERINRAMDDLPRDGAKDREVQLAAVLKDKTTASTADYKKREDEQKERNVQIEKHSADEIKKNFEKGMKTKLVEIEEQVKRKFDKMVMDKVAAEKRIFAAELEEMSVKLKVVEVKLNARLKAERETRRSQELWAAGASLLAATKKGEPFVMVDKELKAIEKASGNDDKLVLTVLKSIPKSVREQGIVPESVLRDGFHTMEKTARSVALVEQEGAAMPVYILSWLQGLLLFMRMSGIPQAEFEKPPVEVPAYLDTFDLLQRASFWMDRGNLAIALRYVDSLKGASRAAAAKWFEQARAHLEVRQAAEAVLAHAAAMGLRYI